MFSNKNQRAPLTSFYIQIEVDEGAVSERAEQVVDGLEGCHEDGPGYDLAAQHLGVDAGEVGQLQDAGRDVRPQAHGTQLGLRLALAQRSDVQTRHFMFHRL